MARQITLNDLPQYSPDWVKRLLGFEKWAVRQKNEAEVIREFEIEKWGVLLKKIKEIQGITLEKVENLHASLATEHAFFDSGEFLVGSRREIEGRHLDLLADGIRPHLAGASALVELGAGYGSRILALSERKEFSGLKLYAYEFTESGQELTRVLARAMNKDIEVGYCDFRKLKIKGASIPEDAVIFTSYAVHYVPELSMGFVGFLAQSRPRAIVHFEPCYEHYATDSLHGMMCRRYAELNDYTRNLVTVLEAAHDREEIAIRMRRNIFGSNPFLPISVIEWSPVGCSEILK